MTDLAELIARLEAASEGSRELDDAICDVTGGASRPSWAFTAPVTTSLDAIVALIERKLPGAAILMGVRQSRQTVPWARVGPWHAADATGASLPLALCIAFLTALQAEQETSEDE